MLQILNPGCLCAAQVVFSQIVLAFDIRSTACFNKVANLTHKLFNCLMYVCMCVHFISSIFIYCKQYVDILFVSFYLYPLTHLDLYAMKPDAEVDFCIFFFR